MIGNVHVTDQEKVITGSSLRYNEKTGETWIKGDPATFTDSTRKGKGAEIYYNEKTNQMTMLGGGQIEEGSTILSYENLNYDEVTGDGKWEGHVVLRDTVSQFGVKADILVRSGKDESSFFYGNPGTSNRAMFYSVVDGDTLFIGADTLAMLNQIDSSTLDTSRIIRAYHDVRLFKSDMQGRTDSLVFQGRDSIFNFFGRPVLWTDTTQFTADSIAMALLNKKIIPLRLPTRR
jgi:lipopolysaccharide export system protein LptA